MKGDYATMVKMRHGLANLNSNNSIVYGRNIKCVGGNILRQKLNGFGEIFCFATKQQRL